MSTKNILFVSDNEMAVQIDGRFIRRSVSVGGWSWTDDRWPMAGFFFYNRSMQLTDHQVLFFEMN